MPDTLIDPTQPPHALIETRNDGSALRNDGVELKPANENPWYVLATLHGEQDGDHIDWDLHEKNRRYWNAWACSKMTREERAAMAERLGLPVADLEPINPGLASDKTIERAFHQRLSKAAQLPAPYDVIDLREFHFACHLVMEKCVFNGNVSFEAAVFSEASLFDSAIFKGFTWFDSASFARTARFESASFSTLVQFNHSCFDGDAVFKSVSFSGLAHFNYATFSGNAHFSFASFCGPVMFGETSFHGSASFWSASFSGSTLFVSAFFREAAIFSDGAFNATTDFRGASFKTQVPKFYQREFNQDTSFSTRKADEPLWPEITEQNAEDGKQAYTRLRQLMNELQKPDEEHFFFRQEMRCKAALEEGWLNKLFFGVYRVLSDYGSSVGRPVAALAFIWAVGAAAMWGYFLSGAEVSEAVADSPLGSAMGLSFSSLFGFFGFNRVYFRDTLGSLPDVLKAYTGFETVAGFVLLFFLGLALRNHFRLK